MQWMSATKALQLKLQKKAGRSAKVSGWSNDMSAKTLKKNGENTSIRVRGYGNKLEKQHCECECMTEGLKIS